jgi:hypothetical protein
LLHKIAFEILVIISDCDQNIRSAANRTMKKMSASQPLYRNPAAPAAQRVKDLLSRMSLDEKAAQMMCVWQKKSETLVDAEGNFDLRKARSVGPATPARARTRAAWRS